MVRREDALKIHSEKPGKLSAETSVDIKTTEDLNLIYTPGVAEPCREIAKDKEKVYEYTSKGNVVGIISDGSAVLGLGDIGPEASLPVMEGKANLMKKFGEVDGFPIVVDGEGADEIVETVDRVSPTLGAVNLEDICAPRCFKVEKELKERLEIPVFHDDQHGTAIVVLAALRNALDLVDKNLEDVRITVIGVGAAGTAVIDFLDRAGAENIVPVDKEGVLSTDAEEGHKQRIAEKTLAEYESGNLQDALEGSDVMIGLSAGGIVSQSMIESMNHNPIVFALANPDPEIKPPEAEEAGAEIVASGRSDFDNQVNNSLAFPGIFRGALDAHAKEINHEMKLAASEAISNFIEPSKQKIVPETLDKELALEIAERVEKAAEKTGVER